MSHELNTQTRTGLFTGKARTVAAVAAFSSGMQWTSLIGGVLVAAVALVLFRVLRADRRVRRVQG